MIANEELYYCIYIREISSGGGAIFGEGVKEIPKPLDLCHIIVIIIIEVTKIAYLKNQ